MPANPKSERNDMTHTTETHPHRDLRRQQGFGLVELGISLTLIAVLLLGAFYIVRNIRTSTVQKEFSQSAYQMMAAGSKYMANQRYTSNLSTHLLVSTGGGQADKEITHPISTGLKAVKSAIPGAWEDVGSECCTRRNGGDPNPFVYANEGIIYRINKVPKEHCEFVVTELGRNASVAKVGGRAWTANTNHPGGFTGEELVWGPALYNRNNIGNAGGSGVANPVQLARFCDNNYTEIMALVVPN